MMKHNIVFIPPVFLFFTIIIIIVFFFLLPDFNVIPFPYNFAGFPVSVLGIIIAGKTYEQFKNNKTTLNIQESSAMITSGIFSRSRNPMYLGMFCLLLGIGICFMNLFSVIAPFVFWLYLSLIIIPKEERLMQKVFGEQYLDYKKKVRRWI